MILIFPGLNIKTCISGPIMDNRNSANIFSFVSLTEQYLHHKMQVACSPRVGILENT